MSLSRRTFLASTASASGAALLASLAPARVLAPASNAQTASDATPWLEIDAGAIAHNARTIARLSSGRPILAVAKNNAYGLGLETAGPILEALAEVRGLAVVRPEEALALRRAGVRKPILLMGPCADDAALELARMRVRLAPFRDDDVRLCEHVAKRLGRPVDVHLYVDTGMSRVGMPEHRALPWIAALAHTGAVRIEGAFTELTEDAEFDTQQTARLRALADRARERGIALGALHAASSAAVMHQPDTHLDMVRPGLALYGGYVSDAAMALGELKPAYRLRAPVVRIEQLRAGDWVSYHRRYVATRPTWIALLPIGHVDGYPSRAVDGCEVLIGARTFRVIGTVSASHTVLEIGDEPIVKIGDVATLVGADHPAIHPNVVAKRAKYSEYDMFMHLSPHIARRVVRT